MPEPNAASMGVLLYGYNKHDVAETPHSFLYHLDHLRSDLLCAASGPNDTPQ